MLVTISTRPDPPLEGGLILLADGGNGIAAFHRGV
jgi:hypothetical protein